MRPLDPHQRMYLWIERIVIGENLCPFAKPSIKAGRFDLRISEAPTLEKAYIDALNYLEWFLQAESESLDSALLVFPHTLTDFEDYLDCLDALEGAIEELSLEGIIQLASFHPKYVFDGEPADDQAHWTNRAPLPAIHLLREERVSEVLDQVSHPEKIPRRNIGHLRSLSLDQLKALFSDL